MTYFAFAIRRAASRACIAALATFPLACSTSEQASGLPSTSGLSTAAEAGDTATGDGDGDGDEQDGTQDGGPTLDLAEEGPECDVWAQDCPAGQKCSWDTVDVPQLVCVPLSPEPKPAGEPCTTEGHPGSGYDDCELGAICSWLDEYNEGVCLALCGGSPDQPSCEGAGLPALCQPCTDCPSLCLPTCDPLDDQCGPGYACTPHADNFACLPADQIGEGGLGAACEYSIQCQSGFACIEGAKVPGCEAVGCCSPFCSLSAPQCPSQMSCVAWFDGLEPPPLPDLGVCVLE